MPERTYTEEEVAAIYAKAAEHQRTATPRDASAGLTLAEVEQAGREAGLDPAAVRAAAAELDSGKRYPVRSNVAMAERWIEAPMSADAWEEAVTSLRHQLGAGEIAMLGEAKEWSHTTPSGARTTVTLSPREGRTLLRVMREYAGLKDERAMGRLMAFFPALILAWIAAGAINEILAPGGLVVFATAVLVLLSAVAFGGPRLASRVRRSRARQAEHVQQIADGLVERIGGVRSEPPTHVASGDPVPLLDPALLDAPDQEADVAPDQRRIRS
jgi:hypothetical protein